MTGLEQIGIAVFGVAAIRLSQDARPSRRRWSCIAGLCAQPFWFWTTAAHGQWAIFGLSFFYTWAWWKGVRTYWLQPVDPELRALSHADSALVVQELRRLDAGQPAAGRWSWFKRRGRA